MALDSYASPNIIPELRQPNAAAGKITLGAGQNGCYAQCEEKKAKYGRISIRTDLVIRLYSLEGTMTNLQLEERFRALEKDYDALISTKYTAQNVLTHTMETYVDSGKYKTGSPE